MFLLKRFLGIVLFWGIIQVLTFPVHASANVSQVFNDLVGQAQSEAKRYLSAYDDKTDEQRPVYQGMIVQVVPSRNYVNVSHVLGVINKETNHGVYISLPLVFSVEKNGEQSYHVTDVQDVFVEYFKLGSTTLRQIYFTKYVKKSPFLQFKTIFAGDKNEYAPGRYVYVFKYNVYNVYEVVRRDSQILDLFFYTFFIQSDFIYHVNEIWVIAPSDWVDMGVFVDGMPFETYDIQKIDDEYKLIHFKLQNKVRSADIALYYKHGKFKDSDITQRLKSRGEKLKQFEELLDPNNPKARSKILSLKLLSWGIGGLVMFVMFQVYKRNGKESEDITIMPEFVVPDVLKAYHMLLLSWLYYYEDYTSNTKRFIRGLVAELFRLAQADVLRLGFRLNGFVLEISKNKLLKLKDSASSTKDRVYSHFIGWLSSACKQCSVLLENKDNRDKSEVCRLYLDKRCVFKLGKFRRFLNQSKYMKRELEKAGLWEVSFSPLWKAFNIVFAIIIFVGVGFLLEGVFETSFSEAYVPMSAEFYGVLVPLKDLFIIHIPWFIIGGVWFWIEKHMGKLTPKGIEVRKALLGLAEYIKQAEAHRIKVLGGNEVSVQELLKHFEDILPFAVLFGMQNKWSKLVREHIPELQEYESSFKWYVGARVTNLQYIDAHINSIEKAINKSVSDFKSSYYSKGGTRISGGRVSGGGFSGGSLSGGW